MLHVCRIPDPVMSAFLISVENFSDFFFFRTPCHNASHILVRLNFIAVLHVIIFYFLSYIGDHLSLCISTFCWVGFYFYSLRSSVLLFYSYGPPHFILHLVFLRLVPPFLIFCITAFLFTYFLSHTLFKHASHLFFLFLSSKLLFLQNILFPIHFASLPFVQHLLTLFF